MSFLRVPLRIAVIGLVASLGLAACSGEKGDDDNLSDAAANLSNLMPIPDTPSTLGRAGVLEAIGAATSAFSAGIDDSAEQRPLAGRRFALRMPFGCPGDQASATDPLRLTVRDDGSRYEARAAFSIGGDDIEDVSNANADSDGETPPPVDLVEGFWIEQPWLLTEQCAAPRRAEAGKPGEGGDEQEDSASRAPSIQTAPTHEHSVGIARFVTPTDSRVGTRSGRDYVKVVTLREGETPPPGLFLLVEGRLRAWPDGKVVRCRTATSGGRPVCIAGATIDRVAFERVDNGTLVAEWTN
jgi:hypothetical protein